jgi:MFS transporter, YNFM family, putative membrane transport protein
MLIDARRLAIALAGFCAFLNLYSPQALLPVLAREFDASAGRISAVMTASSFAIALTAPFTGAVADVLGRKRVIAVAMIGIAAPMAMVATASSVNDLVFWRFVQGLLLPPIFAVTVAYIGDEWPPAEIAGVAGLYVSGSSLGGFSGRFIPGLLTDLIGWRAALASLALLTVIGGIAFAFLLEPERRFMRSGGLIASLRQMARNLRDPRLLAFYAVGFGVLFNFMAVFTYVNFHLAAPPYMLTPSMLGAIFITYLAGTATTPLVGRAVGRLGRRTFMLALLCVWAAGALLLLVPSLAVIIAGLTLCAMCGMMCQAVSTGAATATAQVGRSSAVGMYVTSFYVGGSAGAFLPGLTWQTFGWPAAVAMTLGMLALMALVVGLAWGKADARG